MTRKNLITLTLFTLGALSLAACSSAPKRAENRSEMSRNYLAEKSRLETSDVVSPGYQIRIIHSADPELSGEFKVTFKGLLQLPYKVNLQVGGMTTEALAEKISRAYASYFKVKDSVSVTIASRNCLIEVRGLVQKPGVYSVKLDTSLEEVISMAGGLIGGAAEGATTTNQKPEYARIVSANFNDQTGTESKSQPTVHWIKLSNYFLKYDIKNEVLWHGGEQVFFQIAADPETMKELQGQSIQILGEIHKPGEYSIQPGMDLLTYLGEAGGPTSTADLSTVIVLRKHDPNSNESYDVSDGIHDVELASGDTILVRSTQIRPGFFERVAPALISIGTLALSIALAIAL